MDELGHQRTRVAITRLLHNDLATTPTRSQSQRGFVVLLREIASKSKGCKAITWLNSLREEKPKARTKTNHYFASRALSESVLTSNGRDSTDLVFP